MGLVTVFLEGEKESGVRGEIVVLIKICNGFSFYSQQGVPVAASVLGEVSHTHFRVHIIH